VIQNFVYCDQQVFLFDDCFFCVPRVLVIPLVGKLLVEGFEGLHCVNIEKADEVEDPTETE